MLLTFVFVMIFSIFYFSFDVSSFKSLVESEFKQRLDATSFKVDALSLAWRGGPVVQFEKISLDSPSLSIDSADVQLSYPFFQALMGDCAPALNLSGGTVKVNVSNPQASKTGSAAHIHLKDMNLVLLLNKDEYIFQHVAADISSDMSEIWFKADGIDLTLEMNEDKQPQYLRLRLNGFSQFPATWATYISNINSLDIVISQTAQQSWQWQTNVQADKGEIHIPQAHMTIPVSSLLAEGNVVLDNHGKNKLERFEIHKLHWEDGENFADFVLNWKNEHLNVRVEDGSTTMPMLWSWLWMLGGDSWHQWLNSMQYGRLDGVKATLDLDWQDPLHGAPTIENFKQMAYHVTTHTQGADIALGLKGDFLYQIDADIEVDQHQLSSQIHSAILKDDIGTVSGDYTIAWKTREMDIQAQGAVDVGKLHTWLAPASAKELHWGKAPAIADMHMVWQVSQSAPSMARVSLKPTKSSWKIRPQGVALVLSDGEAVWDLDKGLNLNQMQVKSPWFKGKVDMFLDKRAGWALKDLNLAGFSSLADLTETFSLPIIQPEGETSFVIKYGQEQWSGHLDFTQNDWESFAGFDKQGTEALQITFSGQPTSSALLPINITQLVSHKEDFNIDGSVWIDEKKIDFQFANIKTPALQGDVRLLMPLDVHVPWGIEAKVRYLNKTLLAKYFQDNHQDSNAHARPWSVYADAHLVEWGKMKAEDVHLQFSSDKQSVGKFTAAKFNAGNTELTHATASFTMLEHGKFDLHRLEADGSDQHIIVSGSVKPHGGVLDWQGMVLMNGKFGTLMKQAELDKLFQEGDMSALFLGSGSFKEGEPWWRGMQGELRMKVNDGRIIQGGTLTHLLAAISLIDLPKYFIFQRGDIVGEGLLYKQLQIEAGFKEEQLNMHKLKLVSSAIDASGQGTINVDTGELDLLLVARPWQNIEAMIGGIPFLGQLLTGEDKSLLRKIYRIHGPASDATVDEVRPEDANLPASGFLEELFSLPGQWFGD